jgi:hypothetical protein
MPLNTAHARQLLSNGDLRALFIEELGWDTHNAKLDVNVVGVSVALQALAQKRGMVAYQCPTPAGERLPDYAQRRKIEQQVAKSAHEHLIVFTDAGNETQIWQWVKREPGKPAACREHTFHRSQPGDALLQKLEAIAFTLEEEEQLALPDVTRRTRAGFDVERITKQFYDRFQKEHGAFLKFITGITERTDREWYASVMLNRLMFVYFVQRKGFLDGDRDYLRNRLVQLRVEQGKNKFYSFYRYFLLRLFHEGLGGKKRTPELENLIGRIPYLNGGLFDVHELEKADSYGQNIQIPDQAFERIFDYFDQYQWHLDERPLRADNEINPDVLGYIFEKYINQKQMGAYYTKEDITEYISKNTVVPFLLDAARAKCKVAFENPGGPTVWDLLKAAPPRYIYPAISHGADRMLPTEVVAGLKPSRLNKVVENGAVTTLEVRKGWNRLAPEEYALASETWREVVDRRQCYAELAAKLAAGEVRSVADLVTLNLDIRQFAQDTVENSEGPELLRAFWHAIEKVTILDPTCGSGAFLFAALNILEPLYEACLDRMEGFVEDLARSGEKQRPEKFADFREVLARVQAHPNRRYFIFKSIILNNLYGVDIMEEAVEICKLRLFLKLAAQVEPSTNAENFGIEPLPDIDFNIRAGNTLVGYATYEEVRRILRSKLDFDNAAERIEDKAAELQQIVDDFRARQIEGDGSAAGAKKDELRKRLKGLGEELNRYLASDYEVVLSKKEAYAEWLKSYQPFHWFVEFHGIMAGGGFDVIIGNPPYVEYRKVTNIYRLPREQYGSESAGNLYAFCMERSCHLLRSEGWFGMIVPTAVLGLDETKPLRDVLVKRFNKNWFSTYAIRPSKLFDGVDQRLCICLETYKEQEEATIESTCYQHWNAEERASLFSKIEYAPSFVYERLKRIPQVGSAKAASVLAKLESRSKQSVAHYYSSGKNGFLMHYHRSPRYWIRAMDFEQYFKSPTRTRSVHHFRDIYFAEERVGKFIGAILNSSLFFFWFVSVGNGRNITGADVEQFPVGPIANDMLASMPKLFSRLMRDYEKNSFIRERADCEFQEFRPSLSKGIIDEIDSRLAQHYRFTEEELDFLVNYDIKYRMGVDTDGEEGE